MSVITIMKIESPTLSEYIIIEYKKRECGIKVHKAPERRPTKWPPMTFLGLAVISWGIADTIKAVAPIDAIITTWRKLKNKSTMNIVRVAKGFGICNSSKIT